MARPRHPVPSYLHHKASGHAIVKVAGRTIYLGPWQSKESRQAYARIIAEHAAGTAFRGNTTKPTYADDAFTVAELVAAWRRHAVSYYRDADGGLSREVENFDDVLKPLVTLYGDTAAAEFGPMRLKAVRESMIAAKLARTTINRRVSRLRQVFKWAVEAELIPPAVYQALAAVAGLRIGRSEARETEPVKPVSQAWVDATITHLSPTVAAMVRLQLLTGARPGEICGMRTCEIDTTGKLWVYRPAKHKTAFHGHHREIFIGPKAQDVLRPFLKLHTQAYVFSPAAAEADRLARRSAARKTPLSCGNVPGSNRVRRRVRPPGESYDVSSYRRAIARACELANVPVWHPHQLRHTAATEIRKQFGLEAAGVMLGHKTLSITELYAEKNVAAAMRIAAEVG